MLTCKLYLCFKNLLLAVSFSGGSNVSVIPPLAGTGRVHNTEPAAPSRRSTVQNDAELLAMVTFLM
jgi:hypothetical protein